MTSFIWNMKFLPTWHKDDRQNITLIETIRNESMLWSRLEFYLYLHFSEHISITQNVITMSIYFVVVAKLVIRAVVRVVTFWSWFTLDNAIHTILSEYWIRGPAKKNQTIDLGMRIQMELNGGVFGNSLSQTFAKSKADNGNISTTTHKIIDNIQFSDDFKDIELINLLKFA